MSFFCKILQIVFECADYLREKSLMKKFVYQNSLSLAFLVLFAGSITLQVHFGLCEYNAERVELGADPRSLQSYLMSGHFIESTFENWESEFLQMALFVWLTIYLRQKGSSESKRFDDDNEVDREPDPRRLDAPWPVKKGGWPLGVYKNSLTISLALLFVLSFGLHFVGSRMEHSEEQILKGMSSDSMVEYLGSDKFWFESFQNWQSEFLSVFAIIFLSIYLRQKGSSQSKPVDAPNAQTGE